MQILALLALASTTFALSPPQARSTPTVWLAGDSTMAKNGGGAGTGTDGWGQYLGADVLLPIQNKAIGGRSARSFTNEGRFQDIVNQVKSGDFVVIEFGHNDGGSLSTDNGRTDCFGSGNETCVAPSGEIVQTFVTYVTNAGRAMAAKGAKVVVSSVTPNNPFEGGTFTYAPGRFVDYARIAAQNIGAAASFVDHGQYVANAFEALGITTVDGFFPNDHTHTSVAGAKVVSQAFVKGLVCGNNLLGTFVKNPSAIPGSCI